MINYCDTYLNYLAGLIYNNIEKYFSSNENDVELIREHFFRRLDDKHFREFQQFYFRTINNKEFYLGNNFFKEFRQRYSILGVDMEFIEELESNKNQLLSLIEKKNFVDLYERFNEKKQFGSFFTKFVHTFYPEEYCPIDIPMRQYFGLTNESYFIAFIVLSRAFKNWTEKNKSRINNLKDILFSDNECEKIIIYKNKITDLKMLNIIFWSVSNPPKNREN